MPTSSDARTLIQQQITKAWALYVRRLCSLSPTESVSAGVYTNQKGSNPQALALLTC
jgi:hypothetical protein